MITDEQFENLFTKVASKLLRKKRTLLGRERLRNAGYSVLDVARRDVKGQIVECGTYRGGALAFMSLINRAVESERTLWGFDTFNGLPSPSSLDGPKVAKRGFAGDLLATEKDCRQTFSQIGLDMSGVRLVPGLFQDTLKTVKSEIGEISVLRLDGDWYESTMCCLQELYDQVTVGGWVIIDDYGHFEGCKKAVDEFLNVRDITPSFKKTDYTEVCWIKT